MDLYADLPPDAKGGGTASGVSKPSVSSTGFLMPPPKRPRAGSSGTMLPPPALVKPKLPSPLTPAAQPAMIHSQLDVQRPVLAQVNEPPAEDIWGVENMDPYDPAKPNDYMEFCQERLDRKKEEERRQEMEKYRVQQDEESKARGLDMPATPEAPAVGRGRGRGRGVLNLPAWMTNKDDGSVAGGLQAPQANEAPETEAQASEPRKKNLGKALLAKMGYREGSGLGKDEQGITKALSHRNVGGGQGMIRGPASASGQAAGTSRSGLAGEAATGEPPKKKKRGLFTNPTKVVLLKNMVAPGEVDADLEGETAEECEKYGPVRQCLVFEIQDKSFSEEERVRVFVAFEKQESAVKAYVAMNGRFFDGRQVAASFFDEDRFDKKDLAPREGE